MNKQPMTDNQIIQANNALFAELLSDLTELFNSTNNLAWKEALAAISNKIVVRDYK